MKVEKLFTAYIECPNCFQGQVWECGDVQYCRKCGGDGTVRVRDAKGRFTKIDTGYQLDKYGYVIKGYKE